MMMSLEEAALLRRIKTREPACGSGNTTAAATSDNVLDRTPSNTPGNTPSKTPGNTPSYTPSYTPGNTSSNTPGNMPGKTANGTTSNATNGIAHGAQHLPVYKNVLNGSVSATLRSQNGLTSSSHHTTTSASAPNGHVINGKPDVSVLSSDGRYQQLQQLGAGAEQQLPDEQLYAQLQDVTRDRQELGQSRGFPGMLVAQLSRQVSRAVVRLGQSRSCPARSVP